MSSWNWSHGQKYHCKDRQQWLHIKVFSMSLNTTAWNQSLVILILNTLQVSKIPIMTPMTVNMWYYISKRKRQREKISILSTGKSHESFNRLLSHEKILSVAWKRKINIRLVLLVVVRMRTNENSFWSNKLLT
jgi:hypothetical protein